MDSLECAKLQVDKTRNKIRFIMVIDTSVQKEKELGPKKFISVIQPANLSTYYFIKFPAECLCLRFLWTLRVFLVPMVWPQILQSNDNPIMCISICSLICPLCLDVLLQTLHLCPPSVKVICWSIYKLSLIHIWRCRRYAVCRSRWSPYH